jgi:hypothetical protein
LGRLAEDGKTGGVLCRQVSAPAQVSKSRWGVRDASLRAEKVTRAQFPEQSSPEQIRSQHT